MKKITFLIFLLSLSTWIQAQQSLNKYQEEVQQTINGFFESISNRDSAGMKNYCTADIALYEYGSSWNLDTLIQKAIVLNTAADFKRSNKFEFISTTINKSTAWATYRLQSEMTRNGKQATVQWLETVVLVKEGNRWKIKLLHSTLIKRN